MSRPTLSLVEAASDERSRAALDLLANELHALERLIGETHAASGRLAVAYNAALSAEGRSPLVGHQFVAAMTRVSMHLSDALSGSADGHRLVRTLAGKLGYDVTSYGDAATDPSVVQGG